MKFFLVLLALGAILVGGFFLLRGERVVEVTPSGNLAAGLGNVPVSVPSVPEAEAKPTSSEIAKVNARPSTDIENQKPLQNPPEAVKAIYATGWSAGSNKKVDYLIKLIEETELNAIVIDIKDYSGYVSYYIDHPLIKESGALNEPRILKPNALIKKLHDKSIYAIGRISVFQDSVLARAHPEWALKASSTGQIWEDRKGLAWMDPASREVWDYNLIVAKDALARGFDEINFDYIRFPSDGNLDDMLYPFWDEKTSMAEVIENFFKYLRGNLLQARISADLFGLVTIAVDDLGIGQKLEDALPYFDFVAPMVYPSHYANGVFGFANPAVYPYEIVKNSIEGAMVKFKNFEFGIVGNSSSSVNSSTTLPAIKIREARAKFRPWLQDFDLGADYDAVKVRAQIQASDEAGGTGWMLWDPKNIYTKEALLPE